MTYHRVALSYDLHEMKEVCGGELREIFLRAAIYVNLVPG